jgi:hypothetical protein
MAVAVFAVCGIYQLNRLKDRCLAHCRSPLALLLHYGSCRGRLRDLRVGAHHGGYCLTRPEGPGLLGSTWSTADGMIRRHISHQPADGPGPLGHHPGAGAPAGGTLLWV